MGIITVCKSVCANNQPLPQQNREPAIAKIPVKRNKKAKRRMR